MFFSHDRQREMETKVQHAVQIIDRPSKDSLPYLNIRELRLITLMLSRFLC